MKTHFVMAAAVVATAGMLGLAQAADQGSNAAQAAGKGGNPAQSEAQEFVHDAAGGNAMEVQEGQYMEAHTQSAEVKQLAQTLVQDHQKAQEQLKQAAKQAGVTFDDSLSPVQQAMLKELQMKQGKELDRTFAFMAVGDHHEDLMKYQYASQNLENAALKSYAAGCIPVLKKHLGMADGAAVAVANVHDVTTASER